MSEHRWAAAAAAPQSFTDVVEIVLHEYEPVQPISVIVAATSAVRDRLAGSAPRAATPAAVLVAARAFLDALPPVRDRARRRSGSS